MKRIKWKLRKGMALFLTLVIVTGIIPAISWNAKEVQAASQDSAESTPSVTAFVTQEELMTVFDTDGNDDTVGKLLFGRNSRDNAQEWYIAGKDNGVAGDNIIIFAASPIEANQVFEDDTENNKEYDAEWGCTYPDGTSISEVNPNHYGASDLRAKLKALAENADYFTAGEQSLMNATTVTTKDTKNGCEYTTTDKLYALKGGFEDTGKLLAGSSDSAVIAMDPYWNGDDAAMSDWWNDRNGKDFLGFWLRSPIPYEDESNYGCVALTGSFVASDNVSCEDYSVRPALNLNLSSVLFASAAETAISSSSVSGTIAEGKAMTLRLNGSSNDKLSGASVKYNRSEVTYTAQAGTTLMIQGNGTLSDGTETDWYYSMPIASDADGMTITADDVKTGAGLGYAPDFNNCKIWLEAEGTDGLIYAVMGEISEVSDVGEISESSVTAFATQEELMTVFDTDGNNDTAGKIVFGKDSSGNAQEWYIAGKDTGVSGDNIIIFAASPISVNQVFEDDTENNKEYDAEWGCTYPDGTSISEVNPNHYGASELRAKLKALAENADYFTAGEQSLMNATTVTTSDIKNGCEYTTTDKLYAVKGDFNNDQKLWAGSDDSAVIVINPYWNNSYGEPGSSFWLRSPSEIFYTYDNALYAYTNNCVQQDVVGSGHAVRPASNLNLSSVLFASAAETAISSSPVSGTIEDGKAMTLRLNGTDKAIGNIIYDEDNGRIAASADTSDEGTVSIVVQGSDGVNDWYYSTSVEGTAIVTTDDIRNALSKSSVNLPEDFSLSKCEIWLETTEDNVAYAKMATAGTVNIVTSVTITGVTAPVAENEFDTEAVCDTKGIATTTPEITYTTKVNGNDAVVTDTIADWNNVYKANITLATSISESVGYVFDDTVAVSINGEDADSVVANSDGTLTVTKEFTTAKRKITGLTAPTAPEGNIFTNYYTETDVLTDSGNSELGTQAEITLEGTVAPTTVNMDVEWTLDNTDAAPYNAAPGAENTFKWTVKADEYADYDTNSIAMSGEVKIKNKAAIPVTVTGTDASVDFSGSVIDVSQYFTIDSNAGTADYSLVAGKGTGAGTLNGTSLTVTKTGTFVIKAATEAIGNYASGEAEITLTVDNGTISYTAQDYSGIYDGQTHGIKVEVTNPADTIITYSTDGINYVSDNPQYADEGSYTVYYKIEKENYNTVTGFKNVTVTKKDITITAEDQTLIWGNDLDSKYTISVNSLAAGDKISEITLTPSTTELTDNGTITVGGVKIINEAGEDMTGNYNISFTNGTLEVIHNNALVPDRIEAVKTKTVYMMGDTLDVEDLTVTAFYADGYIEEVTDYTTNADIIDMSVRGDKILTVIFEKNGGRVEKDITITVSAKDYQITAGADSIYTQESDRSITVTGNGEFADFVSIKVDGNVVDENCYTVREGSTIITLKADYMDGLSIGNHTIEIVWKDGSAFTTFTIKETAEPEVPADTTPESPDTGDKIPLVLLIMMFGISMAGIAASFGIKYRMHKTR